MTLDEGRYYIYLLFIVITYGKVSLWLWKSLENSRNFLLHARYVPNVRYSGHFEGERVGTPFPLLKICRNAWERRSHC